MSENNRPHIVSRRRLSSITCVAVLGVAFLVGGFVAWVVGCMGSEKENEGVGGNRVCKSINASSRVF